MNTLVSKLTISFLSHSLYKTDRKILVNTQVSKLSLFFISFPYKTDSTILVNTLVSKLTISFLSHSLYKTDRKILVNTLVSKLTISFFISLPYKTDRKLPRDTQSEGSTLQTPGEWNMSPAGCCTWDTCGMDRTRWLARVVLFLWSVDQHGLSSDVRIINCCLSVRVSPFVYRLDADLLF